MNVIILNSAPGIGKTTTLKLLEDKLSKGYAVLDGDDIGRTIPLKNSIDWLNLIQDNMVSCANNFKQYGINTLIVSFVFPNKERVQRLTTLLSQEGYSVYHFKLVCESSIQKKRIQKRNTQKLISVDRAVQLNERIKKLQSYFTVDTTKKSPAEVAGIIHKQIIKIENTFTR